MVSLRSDKVTRVNNIIVQHLGVSLKDVKPESNFVDNLGMDSLDSVELVMAFEEEFKIEIPDDAAEELTTVQAVYDYINRSL